MDKIIGIITRFNKNDYQIALMDIEIEDQEKIQEIEEKYEDSCSCIRGNEKLCIKDANIEYFENDLSEQDKESKRNALAEKLYIIGMVETDILYDYQADEQLTVEMIADVLKSKTDTAYMLESFLQFCDGNQDEEDHKKFYAAAMDIVRYMETID